MSRALGGRLSECTAIGQQISRAGDACSAGERRLRDIVRSEVTTVRERVPEPSKKFSADEIRGTDGSSHDIVGLCARQRKGVHGFRGTTSSRPTRRNVESTLESLESLAAVVETDRSCTCTIVVHRGRIGRWRTSTVRFSVNH